MINTTNLNTYIDLYEDFLHPNPNINSKAIFLLRRNFRVEFMNNLLNNLKENDIVIRRKSILALGEYGEEIFSSIVTLYFNNKNINVKVSCLKTIIKVIVNFNLKKLNKETMKVVESALKDSSPEIILTVISLLRQLGVNGRDLLMKTSRDKDLLRAKASVSALLEIKDQYVETLFEELLKDQSIDSMLKEDILRDKII
tara:strand:- start:4788 stop:5384 length:597 start_codon:yes stop_codon:yes gene_type:complete